MKTVLKHAVDLPPVMNLFLLVFVLCCLPVEALNIALSLRAWGAHCIHMDAVFSFEFVAEVAIATILPFVS